MSIIDKLRDYQKEAHNLMVKNRAFLNYDSMGLGKTLTTLAALDTLKGYPCLIVVPKFGLMVWQSEIEKWLGEPTIIYSGKPAEREQQWKDFIKYGVRYLITNYALLAEVAGYSGHIIKNSRTANHTTGTFRWKAIVFDEAHMGGLFNHKNDTFKAAAKLARDIPIKYVLTGTPFRSGVVDLFGPLHLVAPNRFDSYWGYVGKYCIRIKDRFGTSIERNPSNIAAFRAMLSEYMIRRLKEEVATELPGKWRQCLYVEMDEEQRVVYDELTAELMAEIPESGDILITPNQMTLQMRQRQLLACPQVLGLKTRGAALNLIMEHSHTSLDDSKPIVIFTPFKKAVPYIEEAIHGEYPNAYIYKITGGLSAEEFGRQWQNFQTQLFKQRILICVIRSGASFTATAAAAAYYLGYEWDFNLNGQAEDRLNRIGQTQFVNIYYAMHRGTVDMEVAARLNEKKSASDWVVGTHTQYLAKLKALHGQK